LCAGDSSSQHDKQAHEGGAQSFHIVLLSPGLLLLEEVQMRAVITQAL
jgi:hypothetical protein